MCWLHDSHGRDARDTTLEAMWPTQCPLPWPQPSELSASAEGYILKSSFPNDVLSTLSVVLSGQVLVSAAIFDVEVSGALTRR